ncbi:MAG: type II secretion system protein [Fimbriimonadaceae bacterium]|nr:type II secretion system protein [Fimbriimonadaceae bacterium]
MKKPRIIGFTLVELLVVIAILVALAGLLLPVLGSAKDSAKRSVCAANLRQITQAAQLYLADNDQRYPFAVDSTDRKLFLWIPSVAERDRLEILLPNAPIFRDIVYPYMRTHEIFRCPTDTGGDLSYVGLKGERSDPASGSAYLSRGTSYVYRSELGFSGQQSPLNCISAMRQTARSDADVILLADASARWHGDPLRDGSGKPRPQRLRTVIPDSWQASEKIAFC